VGFSVFTELATINSTIKCDSVGWLPLSRHELPLGKLLHSRHSMQDSLQTRHSLGHYQLSPPELRLWLVEPFTAL
jgi:hypothetical protein